MSEATLTANSTPTVVLVHGALADGSGWAGVITTLHQSAETASAPTNPLRGLSGGIDELRHVVDALVESLRVPEPPGHSLATPDVVALPASTNSDSPPGPAPFPLGLSGREVEVLRLVTDGLTNAQIAERLFISPKTVSAHLVSIFGKLGVTSRAAATRFAMEHGLA